MIYPQTVRYSTAGETAWNKWLHSKVITERLYIKFIHGIIHSQVTIAKKFQSDIHNVL